LEQIQENFLFKSEYEEKVKTLEERIKTLEEKIESSSQNEKTTSSVFISLESESCVRTICTTNALRYMQIYVLSPKTDQNETDQNADRSTNTNDNNNAKQSQNDKQLLEKFKQICLFAY
jgi:hypothetical protein